MPFDHNHFGFPQKSKWLDTRAHPSTLSKITFHISSHIHLVAFSFVWVTPNLFSTSILISGLIASQMAALIFLCISSSQVWFFLAAPTQFGSSSKGFSLEIIPPYSPKSTLYKYWTNLSLQSDAYFPLIHRYRDIYTRKVRICTFEEGPPKTYYPNRDTSSELTWVQCQECKHRIRRSILF